MNQKERYFGMLKTKLLKWNEILQPGTPVWTIWHGSNAKKEKCTACNGTGKIKLEGESYDCPKCYGDGFKWVHPIDEWHRATNCEVITRVDIEVDPNPRTLNLFKVMYWLGCNGYPPEKVFTSPNMATKVVNKLNKELEEEKVK